MWIGRVRTRLPVAWNTAFAIAGAVPTNAISPSPFIQPIDGGAARAGHALVAADIEHAEIGTAHPLQKIAAHRGHIPQLLCCRS
ncbi:hypothetical protein EV128_11912 [Rhizobium azibense]|nr:hypothetical protein EV128_11912 [Rhizobium azibense]